MLKKPAFCTRSNTNNCRIQVKSNFEFLTCKTVRIEHNLISPYNDKDIFSVIRRHFQFLSQDQRFLLNLIKIET